MPDLPLVLAFDTSAAHCAAALLYGDTLLDQAEDPMARGQAEHLLGLCQDIMTRHDRKMNDLTAIGVGIGPGNFTGIRIAVSAARGMALGLGIPAIGVSTFDAWRFGIHGPCAVAIPGPRDQVYFAAFKQPLDTPPVICPAHELPSHIGPLIGADGLAPQASMAEAIVRQAHARRHAPHSRPAPMYVRAPDAAPAKDAPPVLLP